MTITTSTVNPPVYGSSTTMFSLAQQLVASTEEFAQTLEDINLVPPVIEPNFPNVAAAPSIQTAGQPQLQQVTWNVPSQPAPFTGVININNLIPGPFSGLAPTLN